MSTCEPNKTEIIALRKPHIWNEADQQARDERLVEAHRQAKIVVALIGPCQWWPDQCNAGRELS